MPTVSPLLDSVINALNRANNTLVASPVDVRIKSFVPNGAKATVTIQGKATKPNYGEYTFVIDRVALTDVFGKKPYGLGTALNIGGAATVSQLLMQLGYRYGLRMPANEFQSDAITWNNGTATVTLRAADTSPHFYGSVVLTLTESFIDISTAFTKNNVAPTGHLTLATFTSLVENGNARSYPVELFDFTDVKTTAEAGITSAYNSVVIVKGKPGSGYSGTYNMFFSRRDLSTYTGKTMSLPDDFTGTLYDAMAYENLSLGPYVTTEDLVDSPIDFSVEPTTVLLKAVPGSYSAVGEGSPNVQHYSDDVQTVDIIVAATSQRAPGWLGTAVAAKVATAGKLIINLTVNPGVTLTSTVVTTAPIALARMAAYGTVELNLKNLGRIVGKGSRYGAFTVNSVAGDAITVGTDFNGVINVDNQGLIAGGGGGGSSANKYSSAWYYAYGGAGCAYGEGSTNTGTGQNNGGNGTDVKGGPGAQNVYLGSSTAGWISGGAGGAAGEPGKNGSRYQYTNNLPFYYPFASDKARLPGKVLTAPSDKLKWVTRGQLKPDPVSREARLQAYIASLSDVVVADIGVFIGNVDLTKPISITTTLGSTPNSETYARLTGTPWGGRVNANSYFGGVMSHCSPNADVGNFWLSQEITALAYFETTTDTAVVPSLTRNNNTSYQLGTSGAGVKVVRFIYYDPYLDDVMECNPSKQTTPVRWSGMKDDLTATQGVLNGFK